MGDTIDIPWGLAPQANPNAFMQGYQNARTIAMQQQADHARNDALANPADMNALTKFAVFDPQGADAVKGMLDYQRAGLARQASANLFSTYAAPTQSSYAPPAQAGAVSQPSGALPPVAPGASFQQAFAPVAQGGQQPQPSGQPQSQPLTDPAHPVAQQIGQAALSGQIDPARAWAAFAQYSNPADIEKMMVAVSSMDKIRLQRLDESTGALGSEAQALLGLPQEQRAAALQQIAPMLAQHGVTPDQIQQALAAGLSDQYLHGIVGQVVGTQGLIANAVKERELGQKDTSLGIEQQNANTAGFTAQEAARHNRVDENKPITTNGIGAVIRPDGTVVYDPMNPTVSGFSPAAPAYASALTKVGLPANAVAGFMGNLHVESGFNPAASGDGGVASGVAQWHPDRAAAFQAMFGVPPSQGSPDQVAQFIKAEIGRMPAAQQQAILNAATPAAAAAAVDQYFERSNGATRAQRIAAAAQWASGGSGGAGGAIETQAQAIARGDAAPLQGRAAVTGIGARVMGRVYQINPQYDAKVYKGEAAALTGFLGGKNADLVRSMSVSMDHLNTLNAAAVSLQNGNITAFNRIGQAFSAATGTAAPSNFDAVKGIVSTEVAKAISGGQISDARVHDVQAGISRASSPAQLAGYINQVQALIAGQLHGLQRQYEQTTGGKKDFGRFLSPTAARIAGLGAAPAVGTVVKGYRFKGGDPSAQASWEPV